MKKLKKFILAFLCVIMAAFALTACGIEQTSSQTETNAEEEIRAQNVEDIETYVTNNFVPLLTNTTYEQFEDYVNQGQVVVSYLFDNDFGYRWKEFVDAHGEIQDAKVDQTERTTDGDYTSRIILTGEDNQQMALTLTFDKTMRPVSTSIEDYSDDSKETLGSKMATAAGNTATGLITVFAILVFLIFVISMFNFLPKPTSGKKKDTKAAPAKAPASAPAAAPAAAPAKTVSEDVDLSKNEELVAVIAAAIAASENKPVEGYVVRSIKRLTNNKWR